MDKGLYSKHYFINDQNKVVRCSTFEDVVLGSSQIGTQVDENTYTTLLDGKTVSSIRVSTAFLSVDHSHKITDSHKPMVFETMIFINDGDMCGSVENRYSTWDDALNGHKEIVNQLTLKIK